MTRRYKMVDRALSQDETRARIVAAAVELHESLGPKATTISAIAERAGVQRLTVYRHFPDDAALFAACSASWGDSNPPPDMAAWAAISDPRERVIAGLAALYKYYRRTQGMLTAVLRDEPDVPEVTRSLAGYRGYLDAAVEVMGAGLKAEAVTTLRHAVRFETWVSLAGLAGSDAKAAGLVAGWMFGGPKGLTAKR